jgi:triacylglycerol lipase
MPSATGRPRSQLPVLVDRGRAAFALMVALALWIAAAHAEPPQPGTEHVMLLHGLARGARSMDALAERLRAAGYHVHNVDYPSTESTPEDLLAWLAREEERCCHEGVAKLHFVTHSLGGILLRAHLERAKPANLGRVVLLAPPNQGSEWVDVLAHLDFFELALGPTAVQLGTDSASLPNRIGPPDYELGIIAGRRSINPIGSAILPGDDDGTVSVERTRLEGASDLLVVDASHTFIMRDPEVARQVVWFIERGHFDHPDD